MALFHRNTAAGKVARTSCASALLALSLGALSSLPAAAQTTDPDSDTDNDGASTSAPMLTFGGYGTLGVVHADTRLADFTSGSLRASGAGYTRRWSPTVDSRIGAQLGATFNKQWSAVVQVLSQQDLNSEFTPQLEWINLKYQATPDLALRLGRMTLPAFLAADYRNVGYAYPAARPPLEVYNAIPITSVDGADLSYRWQNGALKHRVQLTYGHRNNYLYADYHSHARALAALTYTAESGPLTARLSAITGKLSLNIGDELFAALRQFGPVGSALAERFAVHDKRATGLSAGASYDPGAWFVTGEVAHMDAHSFLARTRSAYITGGIRRGQFTPYLTLAAIDSSEPTSNPGVSLAGLPPPYAAAGAAVNAGLNALLQTIPVQSTVSAGVRWDCLPNAAVKLQVERVAPRAGSRGSLIKQQPQFRSGVPVHVASVLLDFVF